MLSSRGVHVLLDWIPEVRLDAGGSREREVVSQGGCPKGSQYENSIVTLLCLFIVMLFTTK